MKKILISLAILTMSASLGYAVSNFEETSIQETKAIDEPNIVGTFSIIQSYSTVPFENNTRFLWLKVNGTDYPNVDGQGNYKINDTDHPGVNDILYNSALNSFTLDDGGNTLDTSYHDIQLNMWQRHPFIALGLNNFASVRKVDISEDYLIPSYALFSGDTTSKTYGYYKVDRKYTLTLSEEEAAKAGGGDSEQNWQLQIEAKSEKNSLSTIHIRSEVNSSSDEKLSIIFKFNNSNYTNGQCTQIGNSTFLDKVKIYTDDAKYSLRELVRDNYMTYNLWGETHGFGIAINKLVNAYTAKFVEFEEGTTFPQINGVDYYTFDVGTFKNANTNSSQLGWTTSFTPCNSVKLVTYDVQDESPITKCESVGSTVTIPARAGYKAEVIDNGDIEITNNTFIMPNKDVTISIKYIEKIPEAISNSLETIHIRSTVDTNPIGLSDENMFIVFKFTKSDYVNQTCEDIGSATFLDKIFVYTDNAKYSLRELIRDDHPMMFKLWGEENGFGVPITNTVNAYTAKYFVFEEGTTFPTLGRFDSYSFEAGAFKNNNDNPEQIGWTTSYSPCENPHFITYKEVGSVVSKICEPSGSTVSLPTKRGYSTIATCDDIVVSNDSFVMPEKDIEIELNYRLQNYSITYELDGGTAVNQQTYTINTETFTLVNPTKEGHTFIGWTNDELDVPTLEVSVAKGTVGDKIFIANYSVNSYTVTFDSDGGSQVEPQTVMFGHLATTPTEPTKENLSFLGWFDGDMKFDFSTPIRGDLTLKAKWGRWIIVTFNSNGGSLVSSLKIEAGKVIEEVVNPTKEGFAFDGWFLGETLFDFTQPINDSITLVAHWTDLNPQKDEKKGCGGSVIASSILISTSLFGVVGCLISKKRKDN